MAAQPSTTSAGRLNQWVANAVVRARKRALGHGPVRAQAFFRRNVIVVVMEDSLTEAERALVEKGRREEVMQMRSRLEQTMGDGLVAEVQAITGCGVEAHIVGQHIGPDMAATVFVLDRDVPVEPDVAPAPTLHPVPPS